MLSPIIILPFFPASVQTALHITNTKPSTKNKPNSEIDPSLPPIPILPFSIRIINGRIAFVIPAPSIKGIQIMENGSGVVLVFPLSFVLALGND